MVRAAIAASASQVVEGVDRDLRVITAQISKRGPTARYAARL